MTNTKPVTPQQASEAAKPKNKQAHLRKLVMRKLNRELKKGLRSVRIPNHISSELAGEIANEYKQTWDVALEDHRHTLIGDIAWRFTFTEKNNPGE